MKLFLKRLPTPRCETYINHHCVASIDADVWKFFKPHFWRFAWVGELLKWRHVFGGNFAWLTMMLNRHWTERRCWRSRGRQRSPQRRWSITRLTMIYVHILKLIMIVTKELTFNNYSLVVGPTLVVQSTIMSGHPYVCLYDCPSVSLDVSSSPN